MTLIRREGVEADPWTFVAEDAPLPKGAAVIVTLERWQAEYRRVALAIGGADGLDAACRDRADRLWSLSRLTLPHGLARVLVAEQLYRAWTALAGHPYHRA